MALSFAMRRGEQESAAMLGLVLFAMVVGGPPLPESWSEPKNPDLQAILRQVREDTQEGRHEVALAKALWFSSQCLEA